MQRHQLIGVDIGSDQVRITFPMKELLISEPNVAALSRTNRLTAVGAEATQGPFSIDTGFEVVWPIRQGIIHDDGVLEAILRHIYPRLGLSWFQGKPQIIASAQSGAGTSQMRVMRDVMRRSMSGKIGFVSDLVAISTDQQLQDHDQKVIVNVGGGATTIGVIRNLQIADCQRITCAGHQIDEQIQRSLFVQHALHAKLDQCRQIKHALCLTPKNKTVSLLPWLEKDQCAKELLMTGSEFQEIVKTALQPLVNELRWFLTLSGVDTHQEVLLAGGTAQIPWLTSWLTVQFDRSVRALDDPQYAVIHGVKRIIEQMQSASRLR
ncbi:MAG: rod shape-determining protein [Anaerolineae bacterium]|nr:rod shape-determining protein [Anaerolineae bacterium]